MVNNNNLLMDLKQDNDNIKKAMNIMYKQAEHITLASLIRNESYLCTVSVCHRIDILVFFRNENTECLRIHC